MLAKLRKLLGIQPAPDYQQLLREGGCIIDVRSKAEFANGHIKGSKNIPIPELNTKLTDLKDKNQPIITCCASGMRSASAKSLLRSKGYTKVYNGGSWARLNKQILK